ncbi:MAG: fibronectin type III domain-containing protein, partial [Verrucomicrobia bacterium]|nr:fibronectin type III domain-containing protein [Verrucomicrobiota bacterium]
MQNAKKLLHPHGRGIEITPKGTPCCKTELTTTKNNLRSFGYGLAAKPRIFPAPKTAPRARPIGRGLALLLGRALRGARSRGALGSRPFSSGPGEERQIIMKNLNHFLSGLALFSVLQIGAGAQTNTNYLRLDVGAVSNFFTLTLFGTQSNFNYQILSRDDLKGAPWVSETFVVGPTNTNFAFATISMTNWSRRFFVAGSGEDSDGDGLPDIYELMVTHTDPFNPDTGNTGTMDGAKDLDGDGLSNLEEYLAKTSPVAFSAPPPPFNFKATQTNANGNVLLTWEAVNGPVTNYVIVTDILVGNTVQTIELARLSSNTLSYLDTRGAQSYPPRYRIRALFPGGESASSADVFINTPPARTSAGALLTHGPNGRFRLTVSAPPANLDSVRITRHAANAYYPLIDYAPGAASGWPYANYSTLSNAPSDTNVTLLVENFTNGVAALPETFVPNGFDYTFDVQLILTNNVLGPGESVRVYDSDSADNAVFPPRWVSWGWIGHDWPGYKLPFVDGRANLRANMHFLLRGATATEPFEYQQAQHGAGAFGSDLPYYLYPASTNYVYADFFWRHPLSDQQSYVANDWTPLLISSLNPFLPFHDNRRFQNWLFKASDVVSNGLLGTGVDWNYDFNPGHLLLENPKYVFDEFGFVDNGLTNEPTP